MHGKLEKIQFWRIAGVAVGNVGSITRLNA